MKREFALDLLRVLACFLVIWQHVSEYYYIGSDFLPVREASTYTIGFLTSLGRSAVPLFVMISGYFLLPMRGTEREFFSKRFVRIIGPFVFWGIAYAIYYMYSRGESLTQCLQHIASIPVNFGTEIGHMWYIYVLIGLYLLVPIISPWLQQVSKRSLQVYLGIWFVTSLLPYIHLIFPEIWGECYWNPTPMLYYFTGFGGYFVLGFYLKKFGSPSKPVSFLLILLGYIITVWVFNERIETAMSIADLELSWGQCTGNVVMISLGIFSLVHSVSLKGESVIGNFITDCGIKGYGMYLAHLMILTEVMAFGKDFTGSVLIEIPVLSVIVFFLTYIVIKVLSYLPKSKYWLGN